MQKVLLITTLIICFFLCSIRADATTIACIPSHDGLVVVADKRMGFSNGSWNDAANKIHTPGKYSVVTSTGSVVHLVHVGPLRGIIDTNYVINTYLNTNVTDSGSLLPHQTAIQHCIGNAYAEVRRRSPKLLCPSNIAVKLLDMTLVFKYNPTSQHYEGLLYQVFLFPRSKNRIDVTATQYNPERFASALVMLLGIDSDKIYAGLPPYDSLWRDKCVEKILVHPAKSEDVSTTEALVAGLKFVERVHLNQPKEVGDTIDALVLNNRGVTWWLRNESISAAFQKVNNQERDALMAFVIAIVIILVLIGGTWWLWNSARHKPYGRKPTRTKVRQ